MVRAGGAFAAAEVRRHATDAPAVVVTCLGLGQYNRRAEGWASWRNWPPMW